MSKLNAKQGDRRVPVALGLMALVLALLGSQHVPLGGAGPAANQPVATAFASAPASSR